MTLSRILKATVASFALALATVPNISVAESLRVVKRGTSSTLEVPMNRAVVVESDQPFAELSIANPAIADISSL
jgi:pilus assembly protein CpaC